MGCDIHLHQEVKIKGVWHHYKHQSVARNYQLFGIMAGVRGDGPAVVEPRGIPDDATVLTKFSAGIWSCDMHHASWLSSEEVVKVFQRFFRSDPFESCDWFGYLFGGSWQGFIEYPDDRSDGLEDFRFIFWFDN